MKKTFLLLLFFFVSLESRHITPFPGVENTLFGSWGGKRSCLLEKGITPQLIYLNDPLGNPIGGKKQGFGQIGELKFLFDWDCNEWNFHTSWIWKSGNDLSKRIDNAFNVAELYGGRTYRLCGIHLKRFFCKGNGELKFGRIGAGDDFMYSPIYDLFVNTGYNPNPIAVYFNFPAFSSFPLDTWGIYLKTPFGRHFYVQLGVYNANSRIYNNGFHGWNFTIHNTDGVQLFSQLNYKTENDFYYTGALYQTGKVALFSGGKVTGNYSVYVHLEKQFCGKFTPFAMVLLAPKDRNKFPYFTEAGLIYQPFRRKQDKLCFGFAYGSYSSDLRKMQRREGEPTQNYEANLELCYRMYLKKGFKFTPDIQYVINPKGLRENSNALVMGGEVEMHF